MLWIVARASQTDPVARSSRGPRPHSSRNAYSRGDHSLGVRWRASSPILHERCVKVYFGEIKRCAGSTTKAGIAMADV